ncbi:MAG: hypothetical protein NTW19_11225 [Planctomycetota bacterium]|nr:hypothetical protein [Planctomycetota bacterium]
MAEDDSAGSAGPSAASPTRREFLWRVGFAAAAALAGCASSPAGAAPQTQPVAATQPAAATQRRPRPRLRVAAVVTTYYPRSHADVILENFLQPYLFNGQTIDAEMDVVGLHVDQFAPNDISREVAAKHGFGIHPTVAEALCAGGRELAADAVLILAEQGKYPVNAKEQTEYPRKRFFDEVVAVFERSGRVVPVFNDKHLTHRWDWAKEMYDTARRLKIPLMAGSSVPLAQRRPPLELPPGAALRDAVSIHSGPLEAYGIHALELLQSMVEARAGGETGVRSVQYLKGEPLWRVAHDGLWSPEVAAAAMAAELGREAPLTQSVLREGKAPSGEEIDTNGILVTYRDGLRGIAMTVSRNSSSRWNFGCRIGEGPPHATAFYAPSDNKGLFKALAYAIQQHIREGRSPYPVERTLLTTGVIAATMDSKAEGGKAIETPHLAIAYQPRDFSGVREMGKSWEVSPGAGPATQGAVPGAGAKG